MTAASAAFLPSFSSLPPLPPGCCRVLTSVHGRKEGNTGTSTRDGKARHTSTRGAPRATLLCMKNIYRAAFAKRHAPRTTPARSTDHAVVGGARQAWAAAAVTQHFALTYMAFLQKEGGGTERLRRGCKHSKLRGGIFLSGSEKEKLCPLLSKQHLACFIYIGVEVGSGRQAGVEEAARRHSNIMCVANNRHEVSTAAHLSSSQQHYILNIMLCCKHLPLATYCHACHEHGLPNIFPPFSPSSRLFSSTSV